MKIGLPALIFIVFLFLKLAEIGQVATWSWWWVTSPLWIPLTVLLIIWLGGTAILAAYYFIADWKPRLKRR